MQKYLILFFSAVLFLCACGDDTPKGILTKKQMASLLTDVHLIDGELYNAPQVPDSLYKFGIKRYQAVFKRHNTTAGQFTASFKYYSQRPEQISEIYDEISLNIKSKIDSLNKTGPNKLPNALPQ